GNARLIDVLVLRTTTFGLADFSAFAASPEIFTPRRFGSPTTSPRSRPTFAGSMSMAPTILNPGRDATCFTMAAPIGPSPKCITRMVGITANYTQRHGRRPSRRADARPRRVGVPASPRSGPGKRIGHRTEACRLTRHERTPASPDDIG